MANNTTGLTTYNESVFEGWVQGTEGFIGWALCYIYISNVAIAHIVIRVTYLFFSVLIKGNVIFILYHSKIKTNYGSQTLWNIVNKK